MAKVAVGQRTLAAIILLGAAGVLAGVYFLILRPKAETEAQKKALDSFRQQVKDAGGDPSTIVVTKGTYGGVSGLVYSYPGAKFVSSFIFGQPQQAAIAKTALDEFFASLNLPSPVTVYVPPGSESFPIEGGGITPNTEVVGTAVFAEAVLYESQPKVTETFVQAFPTPTTTATATTTVSVAPYAGTLEIYTVDIYGNYLPNKWFMLDSDRWRAEGIAWSQQWSGPGGRWISTVAEGTYYIYFGGVSGTEVMATVRVRPGETSSINIAYPGETARVFLPPL